MGCEVERMRVKRGQSWVGVILLKPDGVYWWARDWELGFWSLGCGPGEGVVWFGLVFGWK